MTPELQSAIAGAVAALRLGFAELTRTTEADPWGPSNIEAGVTLVGAVIEALDLLEPHVDGPAPAAQWTPRRVMTEMFRKSIDDLHPARRRELQQVLAETAESTPNTDLARVYIGLVYELAAADALAIAVVGDLEKSVGGAADEVHAEPLDPGESGPAT